MQTIGDEKIPITLGMNVKGMLGIESRPLADKCEIHISACAGAIEAALNRDCNELAENARHYPSVFESTHNIRESKQAVEFGPTEQFVPAPTDEAGTVEEPKFPGELSGYRYLMLTHQIALISSGRYTVHENGIPKEITFTVD